MAKTLITGATGFLGTHLLNQLLEKGESQLRIFSSGAPPTNLAASVEIVRGSITNEDDVARAVDGVEKIYHLAGKVSRDNAEAVAIHVQRRRTESAKHVPIGPCQHSSRRQRCGSEAVGRTMRKTH